MKNEDEIFYSNEIEELLDRIESFINDGKYKEALDLINLVKVSQNKLDWLLKN